MTDALAALATELPDGDALLDQLAGPFRRAVRQHPQRGDLSDWGACESIPWSAQGLWVAAAIDPASRLDYHTGVAWPQDAASQLPVALLDPQPGEIVIDTCAAPGSKSTQIGLALGDQGLLVCLDASPARRRVLGETLARQGVVAGLVTPMPVKRLAQQSPGCADAVLVDAPCSGHVACSAAQVGASARRQAQIMTAAARLVRPGGRLVYSTCTPYRGENEDLISAFLAHHPEFSVRPTQAPGADPDLAGLGGWRLWPQRHGTEPFFAIALQRAGEAPATGRPGAVPPPVAVPALAAVDHAGVCYRHGDRVLVASGLAAGTALPSEARGLVIGRFDRSDQFRWEPWGVQWAISQGLPHAVCSHADACRLWSGERLPASALPVGPVAVTGGAPLGEISHDADGARLRLPSRMVRAVA